jgi:hypothetical protein
LCQIEGEFGQVCESAAQSEQALSLKTAELDYTISQSQSIKESIVSLEKSFIDISSLIEGEQIRRNDIELSKEHELNEKGALIGSFEQALIIAQKTMEDKDKQIEELQDGQKVIPDSFFGTLTTC